MKLVNSQLCLAINVNENEVNELVVENQEVFSMIVGELVLQVAGAEGNFVLSECGKVLKIGTTVDVLIDYYSVSVNNRKILGRLYKELTSVGNDHLEEKADINSRMITLLDQLIFSTGMQNLNYELDFQWEDIFKMYNLRFDEQYNNLSEKMEVYLKTLANYTDVRIVFLVNIKSYLSFQELIELYKIADYCKINLFLIESRESTERGQEKRFIIDRDKCFIDAN